MQLYDIAKICSGLVLREKPDYSDSGGYLFVQLKDILEDKTIDWNNLKRINAEDVSPDSLINEGDILFSAKGFNHQAVLINLQKKNLLASAQFFVLRADEQMVLPEYLCWFINQRPAQEYFKQVSGGTNVPYINKKSLSDLQVVIPDMKTQKIVAELYNLLQKQNNLMNKIKEKKQKLANTIINKSIFNVSIEE